MVPMDRPVRVIYAKLTSTGAYDVVAKTPDIPLDRARALAEKLLPGNPPLDAQVGDEIAHLRPPEGGHIVLRFARYGWSDGDRGDVFMTDIVWLSDDDFLRARANAFALVPRHGGVFAELTELPPIAIATRSVEEDLERIAALRGAAEEAKTVVASAAAAPSVLLVHGGDRARAMELFTLLLPPRLRAGLTFQTQAFRVPAVLPRVTLVDRSYANLRDASWRILPSVDVDVPIELAGRLVALADDPDLLGLTHELYEASYDDVVELRPAIVRLTRLAAIADALRRRRITDVVHLLADAESRVRATALRRLHDLVDAATLRSELVQLLQQGGEAAQPLVATVRELDPGNDDAAMTAALIDALPGSASDEVRVLLATRAAFHGDLARMIAVISADPRTALHIPLDRERMPVGVLRLLEPLREAIALRADLNAVALLVAEAVAAQKSLPPAAAAALHRICRGAVHDALDRTTASAQAVAGMRRLQDAAPAYAAAFGAAAPLPPLLTMQELTAHHTASDGLRLADAYTEAARAVIGAALLTRAWDAYRAGAEQECRIASSCAAALLGPAGAAGRELARRILAEYGVPENELAAIPGAEALLPILGGSAPQAVHTRRIVSALAALAAGHETGLSDLVSTVYAAHGQAVQIRPNTEMSQRVLAALGDLARAQSARADAAAVEVALELLGIITEPTHMPVLEDAALGDGVVIRLRRLDRSILHCRAAEDEDRYERYARAVESLDVPIDAAARERLRDALGTRGLKRRLLQAVSSVIERDAS